MSKKNPEMQPDLGYIDSAGKLRDDGLHDEMLDNPKADAAMQKWPLDAAIKSGMSKAKAARLYGHGPRRNRSRAKSECSCFGGAISGRC
jgi:hypothetical protein